VEVGDNFMSDYQTYIKYAKKSIRELEQLANIKKTLKGKKLAEKIRELGLKWITRSAVDSVLHGLGENNGFSNLTPQQKQVAEKLESLKDTALTHKSSSIQGVAEGKITLSTDPKWYGANVGDYQATGPVVNIPATELVGFEPDDKMNQPKSKANVEKILAGLKRGDKLPPLLVRKYKNGYQVLDGHHRWAATMLNNPSAELGGFAAIDLDAMGGKEKALKYYKLAMKTDEYFTFYQPYHCIVLLIIHFKIFLNSAYKDQMILSTVCLDNGSPNSIN